LSPPGNPARACCSGFRLAEAEALIAGAAKLDATGRSWEQKGASVSAVSVSLEPFLVELGLAESAHQPVGHVTQWPVFEP
jgi:hypothetical protein